jgi:hypothetical protein
MPALAGEPQCDLLPGLHAVVVGLLRQFGDGEIAVLVDDGCLGPRSTEGGAGCKDKLEVLVRFLVPENPLGKGTRRATKNRASRNRTRVQPVPALR